MFAGKLFQRGPMDRSLSTSRQLRRGKIIGWRNAPEENRMIILGADCGRGVEPACISFSSEIAPGVYLTFYKRAANENIDRG